MNHPPARFYIIFLTFCAKRFFKITRRASSFLCRSLPCTVLAARNVGVTQQLRFSIDGGVSFKQCSFTGETLENLSSVVTHEAI